MGSVLLLGSPIWLILGCVTEHAKPDEPDPEIVDDLDVPANEAEQVKGGKTPTPGGPVPVPYPNRSGG